MRKPQRIDSQNLNLVSIGRLSKYLGNHPVRRLPGEFNSDHPTIYFTLYNCASLGRARAAFEDYVCTTFLAKTQMQLRAFESCFSAGFQLPAGVDGQCRGAASLESESKWDAHLYMGGAEIPFPGTA